MTLIAAALAFAFAGSAWTQPVDAQAAPVKKWFESISLRGYTQLRYNQIAESDEGLQCQQCDRSLGVPGGVFMRRARLVFSGDVHERVYIYIQPDFASSVSNTASHFAQLRDAYFDLALDSAKEHRIRAGQSKVPYGFENLQSSQNRLALDRNDALNSAVSNERDLGAFYYWAPAHIRKRFSELVSSGLKGSGDYGVFGIGFYNGQTANTPDLNRSQHAVARLAYPHKFASGQVFEAGIQGYVGRYVVGAAQRSAGLKGPMEIRDNRAAASLIIYPQPLGFQSEWNVGEGPEYDGPTRSVRGTGLNGGYVQLMAMFKPAGHVLTSFVRGQYYRGGKKHETDARRYLTREIETGVEWQMSKWVELTLVYAYADRAYEDNGTRGNRHIGGRGRLQLQVNY